jgi:hypothetical protein
VNRKELKEGGCGSFEVRSRDLPGGTEDKPQNMSFTTPNARPIFEPGICRMQFTVRTTKTTCSDKIRIFSTRNANRSAKVSIYLRLLITCLHYVIFQDVAEFVSRFCSLIN